MVITQAVDSPFKNKTRTPYPTIIRQVPADKYSSYSQERGDN